MSKLLKNCALTGRQMVFEHKRTERQNLVLRHQQKMFLNNSFKLKNLDLMFSSVRYSLLFTTRPKSWEPLWFFFCQKLKSMPM